MGKNLRYLFYTTLKHELFSYDNNVERKQSYIVTFKFGYFLYFLY